MSMYSITEAFYHLNKMLIATKHIAVRQRTGTSCMQQSPNLSTSLPLTYDGPQQPRCDWWTPL